jgi:hypothetical protein
LIGISGTIASTKESWHSIDNWGPQRSLGYRASI